MISANLVFESFETLNILNVEVNIHSFNFRPAFLLGRVTKAAAPGGLEIPHGQQQF